MKFFTVERLGPKRSRTPEGFLLCEDVPIARTGIQLYGENEVPKAVARTPDGVYRVRRTDDQVFAPETMASANLKSVTDDHPDDDVIPENWNDLTFGVVSGPRRGVGDQADLLIADMLITNPDAIALIEGGKREVSCGYDADYFEIEPGLLEQRNIRINHVALVDQGRCGSRCAIGDQDMTTRTKPKKSAFDKFKDGLLAAFKSKDEKAFNEALEKAEDEMAEGSPDGDPEGGGHQVVIHNHAEKREADAEGEEAPPKYFTDYCSKMDERMAGIEGAIAKLAPATTDEEGKKVEGELEAEAPKGTGDAAKKAKDSAYLVDSFQGTAALAEIIAPGIRIPTFDRAMAPAKTFDAICKLRRQALDLGYARPETRSFIEDLLGGRDFAVKSMTCDAVRSLFRSVGALQKAANTNAAKSGSRRAEGSSADHKGPRTLADLNKINAEFYGAR